MQLEQLEQKGRGQLTQEEIDELLSAITKPSERAEKEQLLKVLAQLGEGSNKAHEVVERGKVALEGK